MKENPQLFLPFEYRVGGKNEPVAVSYSLGWTVMGPVGGGKKSLHHSVNFLQTMTTTQKFNLDEQVREQVI